MQAPRIAGEPEGALVCCGLADAAGERTACPVEALPVAIPQAVNIHGAERTVEEERNAAQFFLQQPRGEAGIVGAEEIVVPRQDVRVAGVVEEQRQDAARLCRIARIARRNNLHHSDLRVSDPERTDDLLRGIGFPVHHNVPVVGQEAPVVADRIFPAGGYAKYSGLQVPGGPFDQRDQLAREILDIAVFTRR